VDRQQAINQQGSLQPATNGTGPAADSSLLLAALAQIPTGLFVLTSAHETARSGVLVDWVQRCSSSPHMIMVGIQKGLSVEPLIRDSRFFALCQLPEEDRYLRRKFAHAHRPNEDPFIAIVTRSAPRGSPIIERAMSYLECELARRIDLESDFAVIIGQVHFGEVLRPGRPAIYTGLNGDHDPATDDPSSARPA
jgi:flavin reductase (DIM6/NTAB) family NADH-FMN oxidoreductase RutF